VLLAVRRNDKAKERVQTIVTEIKQVSEQKKATKKRKAATEATADGETVNPKKPKHNSHDTDKHPDSPNDEDFL